MSRYEDIKEYKENIETLFSFISNPEFLDGYKDIEKYIADKDAYRVSFFVPNCRQTTHGENVQIQLKSDDKGVTTVHVVSESIVKESDCGNNRTHVISIFYRLDKRFQPIGPSKKANQEKKLERIVALVLVVILILGIASCSKACFSGGGNGSSSSSISDDKCATCQGTGLVNEGFFNFKTCPTCRGTGIPRQ